MAKKPKRYALKGPIKKLAPGRGGCIATDMITVDGMKVGIMYRMPKEHPIDSGWRFYSGKETPDYLRDPNHVDLYEVNDIANFDPDIIPFLDEPTHSVFARQDETGPFAMVYQQSK